MPKTTTRSSKLFISKEVNPKKVETLNLLTDEMLKVLTNYVDLLWAEEDTTSKFFSKFKCPSDYEVETWLSYRLKSQLVNQANALIKSQRKRRNKTKPSVSKKSFLLTVNSVDFEFTRDTHFDGFIRLSSIGAKLQIKLPFVRHKHFNKLYRSKQWKMSSSAQLGFNENGRPYFTTFFKRELPDKKLDGKALGIDIGYKKLIATSDGDLLGTSLEKVYEKISKKKRGSKAHKRSLIERTDRINEACNLVNLQNVNKLIVEDLKNVKKNTKKNKSMSSKFVNKLQYWSYSKVLNKLSSNCELEGVNFIKVDPAYTSQTCSKCGTCDKNARKQETYTCKSCGSVADSDINAACNILMLGESER